MFGAHTFGSEEFAAVAEDYASVTPDTSIAVGPPVSNRVISGALGTFYCGQIPLAGAQLVTVVVTTGSGGWTHRGPIKLPERKKPGFKPVSFKKPNPYRW